MKTKLLSIGSVIFLFCTASSNAQFYVTASNTLNLAESVVNHGDAGIVTNVTYLGDISSGGTFHDGSGSLGITDGILLTSGSILNSTGPNLISNASTVNFFPGDVDLTSVASEPGYMGASRDACVLEFDFVPASDTIKIRYVFASEEYPEMIQGINDAFGIFVSGPGIYGPYSSGPQFPNGSKNFAFVPVDVSPATVTTLNINPNRHSNFYRGNDSTMSTYYFQYDGMTIVLTATIPVVPCEVYHFKFAIADGGDYAYDSGVFIEAMTPGVNGSIMPFPVITRNVDTLFSNFATGNQWYLNDSILVNDTNSFLVVTTNGIYKLGVTNVNGCGRISYPVYFNSVGINESEQANNQLNIYPNPFNQLVYLEWELGQPASLEISIVDIYGKIVYKTFMEKSLTGKQQFDLEELPAGVYIVNANAGNWNKKMKLVKQ